jgi:hypothetical protein
MSPLFRNPFPPRSVGERDLTVLRVLLCLAVALGGVVAHNFAHRLARVEYELTVVEGQISALQDDDGDVAMALAERARAQHSASAISQKRGEIRGKAERERSNTKWRRSSSHI